MVTADFEDYFDTQRRVDALYRQKEAWAMACITNIAGMGWFSSDRAVRTYATEIWHAPL
jgi:starch phosphorylase